MGGGGERKKKSIKRKKKKKQKVMTTRGRNNNKKGGGWIRRPLKQEQEQNHTALANRHIYLGQWRLGFKNKDISFAMDARRALFHFRQARFLGDERATAYLTFMAIHYALDDGHQDLSDDEDGMEQGVDSRVECTASDQFDDQERQRHFAAAMKLVSSAHWMMMSTRSHPGSIIIDDALHSSIVDLLHKATVPPRPHVFAAHQLAVQLSMRELSADPNASKRRCSQLERAYDMARISADAGLHLSKVLLWQLVRSLRMEQLASRQRDDDDDESGGGLKSFNVHPVQTVIGEAATAKVCKSRSREDTLYDLHMRHALGAFASCALLGDVTNLMCALLDDEVPALRSPFYLRYLVQRCHFPLCGWRGLRQAVWWGFLWNRRALAADRACRNIVLCWLSRMGAGVPDLDHDDHIDAEDAHFFDMHKDNVVHRCQKIEDTLLLNLGCTRLAHDIHQRCVALLFGP